MDEKELKKRIQSGEDFHTEFKEALPDKEPIAKSIVSFANTDGGQLILGVRNSGDIMGIENADSLMRIIDDIACSRCEPPITVVQETIRADDRIVLVVNVPKGSQRPYRTMSGRYYIRAAKRSRQASREELLRLFQSSESLYYDETPLSRAFIEDIDKEYFRKFMAQYFSIITDDASEKNYLMNLRALDREDRPTVAGVLFFGKEPQRQLPEARIVCAVIHGVDISTAPADKKSIEGNIPYIIGDTQRFLRLYLAEEHRISGFEPEAHLEIPEIALRESFVNAIAHRDYTINSPIRIIIYLNRVEVRTPGKLPNRVTIESIRIGASHVLRNPTIYNLLAKMGLVTDLGSGVRRIITSVQKQLGKDVILEETDGEFVVIIPRR